MKLIHNVCGLLLLAFLLLLGVLSVGTVLFEDSTLAAMVTEFLKDDIFIVRMGFAVLTVTLVYMISASSKEKKNSYLSFTTENGSVQVNLSAASNYLGKLKKEFAAVVSLTPKLKVKGKAIDAVLKTGIKSGTRIPELSTMLQQRARECLSQDLGLENISDVRIVIHEISGAPPPSREPDDQSIIDMSEEPGESREKEKESELGS